MIATIIYAAVAAGLLAFFIWGLKYNEEAPNGDDLSLALLLSISWPLWVVVIVIGGTLETVTNSLLAWLRK